MPTVIGRDTITMRRSVSSHHRGLILQPVLCALLLLGTVVPSHGARDGDAQVTSLRYPKASDCHVSERKDFGSSTVSCIVHLQYPADNVLHFYDHELKRLGWVPFAERTYRRDYRKWDCFRDLAQPNQPFIHQLGAKWANRKRTRMVTLVIFYRSYAASPRAVPCPAPDDDIQRVFVQVMPFVPLPEEREGKQSPDDQ